MAETERADAKNESIGSRSPTPTGWGRGPYMQPPEPGVILETPPPHCNKCTVRRDDGTILEQVHADNLLLLPDSTCDLEREPWSFEDEDTVLDIDSRRSPGQMIEDN